jgi:hypothetical protein
LVIAHCSGDVAQLAGEILCRSCIDPWDCLLASMRSTNT